MTEEDFMAIAWRDFILWAASEPEMRKAFREATGKIFLPPPNSGLEAMIDEATGVQETQETNMAAFVEWVTREHWGFDYAPAAYQRAVTDAA